MRKLLRRLAGILLFLLAFAPIPLMGGARLLGSVGAGFLLLVPAVPLSLLLSLVPGRIGGKIKEEPVDNTPHKYETESNRRFLAEDAVRGEAEVLFLSTASKNWRAILHFYIDELGMEFWNARLYKRLTISDKGEKT